LLTLSYDLTQTQCCQTNRKSRNEMAPQAIFFFLKQILLNNQ
jgi:hypothetical protein